MFIKLTVYKDGWLDFVEWCLQIEEIVTLLLVKKFKIFDSFDLNMHSLKITSLLPYLQDQKDFVENTHLNLFYCKTRASYVTRILLELSSK